MQEYKTLPRAHGWRGHGTWKHTVTGTEYTSRTVKGANKEVKDGRKEGEERKRDRIGKFVFCRWATQAPRH